MVIKGFLNFLKWVGSLEKDLSWEKEKADPSSQQEEAKDDCTSTPTVENIPAKLMEQNILLLSNIENVVEQKAKEEKKTKPSLLWAGREAGWSSDARRRRGRGSFITRWRDEF
jgi:hypothetical protein